MEFCRKVEVDRLPPSGETIHDIAATEPERAELARRFALVALDRLEARATLVRLAGGLLRLTADLLADVVQECVVTLEPVASRVEDRFILLYGHAQDEAGEVVLSGEAELVEPVLGGTLDIGEAVAQQLSLALDPYPRAPGAAAPAPAAGPDDASPFAPLAKWKEKD
jgi:Large ribosomal RNA subunit accumulation protein YceD